MDSRLNCYLNSAYHRNMDDFDDTIEIDSPHPSFDESGENETFVDDPADEHRSCYSEDHRLQPLNDSRLTRRSSASLQRMPYLPSSLPSTPKKQNQIMVTPTRNLRRREATVRRRRSFSAPRRRETTPTNEYPYPILRRSKSSLSIRQRVNDSRFRSTAASPTLYYDGYLPPLDGLPLVTSVPLFDVSQSKSRNQFLRRPYDANASFSSTRPLVARNTAVISPTIYTKEAEPMKGEHFEEGASGLFTIAADRSKRAGSWINMKRQTVPECTLRTCGVTLLVTGVLNCLLCFHIMTIRGKSGGDLSVSLLSSFVTLCLGFTCVWIQQWDRLPNRNYVSGYVILSLFSVLQSATLWILDKNPFMRQDLLDITKGVLYGLACLTLTIASFGIGGSCCCKHPPRDNRVAHGVRGFTI